MIPLAAVYATGAGLFFAATVWAYRTPGILNHHTPWFFAPAAVCAAGWPIYLAYWWAER